MIGLLKCQELHHLAQTVIVAHLMPTAMMANIEAELLLHNSVLMPMPPRLITLLYKNAKGQLNSLEKYGTAITMLHVTTKVTYYGLGLKMLNQQCFQKT
jgi:hypothetical protein